jgi:hypothetical protein
MIFRFVGIGIALSVFSLGGWPWMIGLIVGLMVLHVAYRLYSGRWMDEFP